MERDLRGADSIDSRQYDRIWQRVAPTLEPYPGTATSGTAAQPQTAQPLQTTASQMGTTASAARAGTVASNGQTGMTTSTGQMGVTAPVSQFSTTTPAVQSGVTTPAARTATTTPGSLFGTTTPTAWTAPTMPASVLSTTTPTAWTAPTMPASLSSTTTPTVWTAPTMPASLSSATTPTAWMAPAMPANLLTATTPTVQAATTTNQTTATAQTTQSGTTGQTGMMQNSQNGMEDQFCCMVSMTNEDLQILTNFIEDELYDQRYYQAFAHQAPGWARKTLMDFSVTEGAHARRLMAVYFLITGSCYTPSVSCERIWIGPWCSALRERYHMEACGGQNYIRAAQSTNDPCLSKLLMELSEDEYGHAETILTMLQKVV